MPRAAKSAAPPKPIFQFQITLLRSDPPIWRRIQMADATIDVLHVCIQAAMGWENEHLHKFNIGGVLCGEPDIMEGYRSEWIDSTEARLSEVLAKRRKSFRFYYEYDFGDDWRHEIVFEGMQPAEPGVKYPRCLEGERACPPEDIGGVGRYEHVLDVIDDPQHEDHEHYKEWLGSRFDPDKFSAQDATKAMQRGVPTFRV